MKRAGTLFTHYSAHVACHSVRLASALSLKQQFLPRLPTAGVLAWTGSIIQRGRGCANRFNEAVNQKHDSLLGQHL